MRRGPAHVGRKVIAKLPVGGTDDAIRPAEDEEGCSGSEPPEGFLVLSQSVGLAGDPSEENKGGDNGGKKETLADDTQILAGLDAWDGSRVGELFARRVRQTASHHGTCHE